MRKYLSQYLDYNSQINLIGFNTAFLSILFTGYYFLFSPNNPFLMASVLGILLTAVMMSATYHDHHSIERNGYGLMTAILAGIAYALGAFTGHSLILSSLFILCVFPWAALIDTKNVLLFWLLFYICDAYIIGFGVSKSHLSYDSALHYALYYMIGGIALIATGFVRIYIRHTTLKITDSKPTFQYKQILSLTRYRFIFAFSMTVTVLIANAFAHSLSGNASFWITMTTFILFKQNDDVSLTRTINRIVGTFIGCLLTFVLFYFFSSPWFLIASLFVTIYLTIIANSKHYASYTFFLTIAVILIMSIIEKSTFDIILARFFDTIVAVFFVSIALLCMKKFQPQ